MKQCVSGLGFQGYCHMSLPIHFSLVELVKCASSVCLLFLMRDSGYDSGTQSLPISRTLKLQCGWETILITTVVILLVIILEWVYIFLCTLLCICSVTCTITLHRNVYYAQFCCSTIFAHILKRKVYNKKSQWKMINKRIM